MLVMFMFIMIVLCVFFHVNATWGNSWKNKNDAALSNALSLVAVLLSGIAFMCFVGVALNRGGGILWSESFAIEAKIASFSKLTYTNFKIMYILNKP